MNQDQMNQLPHRLQSILWSKDIAHIDSKEHAPYIIHQILSHGGMDDFRWIFSFYHKETIRQIFIRHPYKDYPKARFNFIKNFLLELSDTSLDEKLYVRNIPRSIGYK